MSTQLACERKHSQAWLLWVQTRCPYGSVQVMNLHHQQTLLLVDALLLLRWESETNCFQLCLKTFWNWMSASSWSWKKESWQILFTKDKLLRSPYAWQGQWMWFSMTPAYQNSLTMTGISCCDFDTSQYHSHFDGACLPDSQRWQENSDNGKVEEEALKRPKRGLSPLGNAIMTLLSLSMSIALQCPAISNHIQTSC